MIARRTGQPLDQDPWQWNCGFYPGSEPRECCNGTAATFDQGRIAFGRAWRVFLARRTEADFQAWRHHRDITAWKYAMRDKHLKLPTQLASGQSHCFCGMPSDIAGVGEHVDAAHRAMAHPS